ncbi:hypothetical protein [Paenibacillus sp. OSY-SE]|uniref:hypothetical protein n=1 Tax=Paenibacillus sp. OSY-SE TaxID=1196323 RepID=UPI0002FB8111|nr:hypothetical protein [Paenibacillus sp. OSY-SE]
MKSHQKLIAILSVTSLLLMAAPVSMHAAEAKPAAEQKQSITLDSLDKETIEKLNNVVKELSSSSEIVWKSIEEGGFKGSSGA